MPYELKDRPSDATGAIRPQPRMERVVPVEGSRKLAHNTPTEKKKGVVDFPLPEIEPLVINSRHIATGQEAFLARSTIKAVRKKIQEELQAFRKEPNNPQRRRLIERRNELDKAILKATRFLNQWTNLDNNRYLQYLIDTNDELASSASQLLYFRIGMPGVTFSPEQEMQMRVISEDLRDKLLARIREKQRGGKS